MDNMENVDAMEAAQKRTAYRLTYARTETPRPLHSNGMDGPMIPCSYEGIPDDDGDIREASAASGDWMGSPGVIPDDATPEDWIRFWFLCAIDEAVHEALEYFHVDGKQLLDPHGRQEMRVFDITGELGERLLALSPLAEGKP